MKVSEAISNFNKTTITGSDKYNLNKMLEMLDKNFIEKRELREEIETVFDKYKPKIYNPVTKNYYQVKDEKYDKLKDYIFKLLEV